MKIVQLVYIVLMVTPKSKIYRSGSESDLKGEPDTCILRRIVWSQCVELGKYVLVSLLQKMELNFVQKFFTRKRNL